MSARRWTRAPAAKSALPTTSALVLVPPLASTRMRVRRRGPSSGTDCHQRRSSLTSGQVSLGGRKIICRGLDPYPVDPPTLSAPDFLDTAWRRRSCAALPSRTSRGQARRRGGLCPASSRTCCGAAMRRRGAAQTRKLVRARVMTTTREVQAMRTHAVDLRKHGGESSERQIIFLTRKQKRAHDAQLIPRTVRS